MLPDLGFPVTGRRNAPQVDPQNGNATTIKSLIFDDDLIIYNFSREGLLQRMTEREREGEQCVYSCKRSSAQVPALKFPDCTYNNKERVGGVAEVGGSRTTMMDDEKIAVVVDYR
ncbi:hypothetical protein R1flu_011310 [Riccia fluitans]|uniref:Uncharacterized protein n=1 Tax=Riccia fluitans TaxID=41844 RepID=A0ABD1Z7G4_9MARC